MAMGDEVAPQVWREFPDVKWNRKVVDGATARMVNQPATLDTSVATTGPTLINVTDFRASLIAPGQRP